MKQNGGRADTLASALEREHREIDQAIEVYLGGRDEREARITSLTQAITALRRHIFLEEEFLFPPLDDAYLEQSIANADAQVVKGYHPGIMAPAISGFGLTSKPDEIRALVAFIKSQK